MQYGLTNSDSNNKPDRKHKIARKPITHEMAEWKQSLFYIRSEVMGQELKGRKTSTSGEMKDSFQSSKPNQ